MQNNPEAPDRELDEGTWNQFAQGDQATPSEKSSDLQGNGAEHSVGPSLEGPSTVPVAPATATPFTKRDSADPAAPVSADSDENTPKPGAERSDEWDLLPAPKIEKGQVLFGKYLLEEKLGEGGMGQVWRVENILLQRESALKLIRPEIAQNDKGWKRFEREARLMAKITHHNAVGVYDFRRSHSMGYIEMELIPGISLHDFLKRRKGEPLAVAWVAQFLDQLCSVLQEAHGHLDKKSGKAKPIIHRDLKPSNLMLVEGKQPDQNLKVLDFGIAKIAEDEGNPELTGQGDFLGTPDYMSPEQIRGGITKEGKGGIDGRSDLYAVGVLLYQLLTGTLPFKGMNKMGVLAAHLHSTIPGMKTANPHVQVPPQIERLVMKCLEKDPDLRPQSAHELARLFREAIKGHEDLDLRKPLWKPAAWPIMAACVLLTGLVFATSWVLKLLGTSTPIVTPKADLESTDISGTPAKKDFAHKKSPDVQANDGEPGDYKHWMSQGYEPLTADRLQTFAAEREATLDRLASDLRDGPAGLRRKSDKGVFYAFATGVYLPLGYVAEDPSATDGFWPKVIIRTSDKVRFIRINGGKYFRGDFRNHTPIPDLQGKPCTPHEVEVSGFYIQETEVTNKEIDAYLKKNPEAKLMSWKKGLSVLVDDAKRPEIEVMQYPAVLIDRATAQEYAHSVDGRLPREAEWEYAARSRGQRNLWAWKNIVAKKGGPKAHLATDLTEPFPVPVKTFAGDDETDQRVLNLTGNVREWCHDAYRPYSELIAEHKARLIAENKNADLPMKDPMFGGEPETDQPDLKYVVRGGSFIDDPQVAYAFQRDGVPASKQLNYVGFRVVIQCPPEPAELSE